MVKKNKTKNKSSQKEDIFSFDNEIVIGVTKLENEKKAKKVKDKKDKSQNKKKKTKTQKNNQTINKEKNKIKNKKKIKRKPIVNKKVKTNINIDSIYEDEKKLKNENVKKQKHINPKLIKYLAIIGLIIIAIICAMFSPIFNIKNITVENNEKISQDQIISLSQIQKEDNTYKISSKKVEKLIKENAYIESAKIIRKLPSTIIIKVQERKEAYIIEYSGNYVYIDKNGYILDISNQKSELPILQGLETEDEKFVVGNRLCMQDLKKIVIVERIMELAKNNEIKDLITRIDIENEEKIQLILENQNIIAHIGNNSNINTKLLTIKAILEKIEKKSGEIFVDMDLNKDFPIFRESV